MSAPRREKSMRLIAAFPTAMAAMTMEKACRKEELSGRLIPVPRAISASCGMAWCAPPEERGALEEMTGRWSIPVEGWYYVMLYAEK